MFSSVHDDLIVATRRAEWSRKVRKIQLINSLKHSSSYRQPYLASLLKWLQARITNLRCVVFPLSASPACVSQ